MTELEIFKIIDLEFDEAIKKITESLKKEGFGILSDLDFQGILKKKIDVDIEKYRVLGACNPNLAIKALNIDRRLGTLLPCNVYLQEQKDGKVKVSAINPKKMFEIVDTPGLEEIVNEATEKIGRAINSL